MGIRDPRVDTYIAKSADFAKPILSHLREAVHAACPKVHEEMKWSFPHFMYKGMLCSMAAFKQHCAFGFWKGALVLGGDAKDTGAMGQFGRITKLADLPSKNVLAGYVKNAAKLNDQRVNAAPREKRPAPKALRVPADLATALETNKKAQTAFETLSPSHRREYVEWITEAKKEVTRKRRLQTAIRQISEGKSQNWKYERK